MPYRGIRGLGMKKEVLPKYGFGSVATKSDGRDADAAGTIE